MSLLPQQPTTISSGDKQQKTTDASITALFAELKRIEDRPNVFTMSQFERLAPLFRTNSNLTSSHIEDLTVLYQRYVDFYKPTEIIRSAADHTVILTLPPVFTPVKSLSSDDHNDKIIDINSNMSGSDIPKYRSVAFNQVANALLSEQRSNINVIQEYRRKYADIMQKFNALYGNTAKTAVSESETSQPVPFQDTTTWEYE